ncbi:MAG: IMP dehydrogenase, partial [Akkermansiaceae bacterium]|nr:IMP dehydrogenase [Akkermansiaceae bacterium]
MSELLPSESDVRTELCDGIPLNIPVVSAAMDTVSETELAMALAREGGIAVIHRACPIDEQASMVAKVKRSENAVIQQPLTVSRKFTVAQVREIMEREGFSGFPVVDENDKLEGMVTGRDLRHVPSETALVEDVMTSIEKLVTAPVGMDQHKARVILYENRIEKLPLINADGTLGGLITGADIEKRITFTNAAKDPNGQLRCGAAVGPGPEFLERAKALIDAGADALFIDAATGHTSRVMEVIGALRGLGNIPVVAGNVVTSQGAKDLISAGANCLKVGVGPGSICTTRV